LAIHLAKERISKNHRIRILTTNCLRIGCSYAGSTILNEGSFIRHWHSIPISTHVACMMLKIKIPNTMRLTIAYK
jgi:hypothetical protein